MQTRRVEYSSDDNVLQQAQNKRSLQGDKESHREQTGKTISALVT